MRDIILLLIIFGAVPVMLMRPHVGVYLWSWFAYMNPHRFSWGFAYDFPFAQVIVLITAMGFLFSKEPKRIIWTPVTICLVLFILWMGLTTLFALNGSEASYMYSKVIKIQIMTFATLVLISTYERLNQMIWVVALSLGFYGVKGGFFSVLTKGEYMVLGPEKSFFQGNTELGLALIMTVPLMVYLWQTSERKWVKYGLLAAMGFTALAILSTYSRGAFLGISAMAFFLVLKSQKKLVVGMIMILLIPLALSFMPDKWGKKMETIQTYEEDASAMGRIVAWKHAYNMASQRFVGGGFESFNMEEYQRFSPNLELVLGKARVAHSIYFQVLGHHGFVGLGLFLMLGILAWRTGTWIIRNTKGEEDLIWANNLTRMVQASLIGFAVSGAFLSLAYFDLYYHLIAILVITKKLVEERRESSSSVIGEAARIQGAKLQPRVYR